MESRRRASRACTAGRARASRRCPRWCSPTADRALAVGRVRPQRWATAMGDGTRGGWFARALDRRDAHVWVALLAAALVLPTLGAGLLLDDWMHRLALDPAWQHPASVRGPWDLYRFITDDRAFKHLLLDRGTLPWWTVP